MLKIFHEKYPQVHVNIVTHFSHPDEFLERDSEGKYIKQENGYKWLDVVKNSVENLSSLSFVSMDNQTPIIDRVNNNSQDLHVLHEELRRGNIKPKYIFQCREIEGHRAFAVPVEESWKIHNESQKGLSDLARSRFAMSTEWGKLEVVSVLDGISDEKLTKIPEENRKQVKDALGDGIVVFKVHRSPFSADTQGDLVIAKRNPEALWISGYEDRIIYDGRKSGLGKYTGLLPLLSSITHDESLAKELTKQGVEEKAKSEIFELAQEEFHTAYDVARILNGRGTRISAREADAIMRKLEKEQDVENPLVFRASALPESSRGVPLMHISDVDVIKEQFIANTSDIARRA